MTQEPALKMVYFHAYLQREGVQNLMEVDVSGVVVDAQGRHPFSRFIDFPGWFPRWQPQRNLHLRPHEST